MVLTYGLHLREHGFLYIPPLGEAMGGSDWLSLLARMFLYGWSAFESAAYYRRLRRRPRGAPGC